MHYSFENGESFKKGEMARDAVGSLTQRHDERDPLSFSIAEGRWILATTETVTSQMEKKAPPQYYYE